jgi:hypothetical protein
MLTAGMVGVAAATALMITVGPGTSLWWIRALLLLLGLSWAQALVPLQAAAFATISPPPPEPPRHCSPPAASSVWRLASRS